MCGATRRSVLAGTGAAATLLAVPSADAAGRLPKATVAARRKFFGAANVDPRTGAVRRDRVVLSWFGCASFAMAIDGRVVLLDAWVPRGTHSGRVPTDPAEVAALRPTHVLIGHGHFDHAADAGPIAAATGAVVVGTTSHCAQAASLAPGRIRTRRLRALRAPGDRAGFALGPRVRLTAVRHVHSAIKPPDGGQPMLPLPDLLPLLTHPPTLGDALDTLSHQLDQEGGSVLYRFQVGGFSLVWHDTAGPLREEAPQVLRMLRRMPRPDVHIGTIQGFNQYTNGLRDPLDYAAAVRGRVFVPTHHDNWLPPISVRATAYEGALREGIARIPARQRPRVRYLVDPDDYVAPGRLTFRV